MGGFTRQLLTMVKILRFCTIPLQLQLIPVICSDFNPSREVGLAVDKLGLTIQMPLLASQNLFIDNHVTSRLSQSRCLRAQRLKVTTDS